jgi:hypothetical protein
LSSPYSYIKVDIPNGSNLDLHLLNGSTAELMISGSNKSMYVSGGEIDLAGIKGEFPNIPYVPVLMKQPGVRVEGTLQFQELRSNNPHNHTMTWANAVPARVNGNSLIKLDYVNNDVDNSTRYITYFHWLGVDANTDTPIQKSRVNLLLSVPLVQAMKSVAGTKLAVGVLVSAALVVYLGWSRFGLEFKRH